MGVAGVKEFRVQTRVHVGARTQYNNHRQLDADSSVGPADSHNRGVCACVSVKRSTVHIIMLLERARSRTRCVCLARVSVCERACYDLLSITARGGALLP